MKQQSLFSGDFRLITLNTILQAQKKSKLFQPFSVVKYFNLVFGRAVFLSMLA